MRVTNKIIIFTLARYYSRSIINFILLLMIGYAYPGKLKILFKSSTINTIGRVFNSLNYPSIR
jgi:hypothetical protein